MRDLSNISGDHLSILSDNGLNNRAGVFLFCLSAALHLVFFSGVMLVQGYHSKRVLPPAIQVNLVSFTPVSDLKNTSGPSVGSPPLKKQADLPIKKDLTKFDNLPAEPEIIVPPKSQPEPEVSVEPKPVPKKKEPPVKKKSLKSKTYKPSKVLDSARKSIEKSIEEEKQKTLDDALSRLKEQVKKEGGQRSRAESVVSGPQGGSSQGASQAIDLYNLELMYRIQQNWAFNERLAGADGSIEVRILIKILKNGQLRDIWFETRSGNRYLDDSALKAVKKSAPFPPLPKGYQFYDVGLRFTPSGLK